MSVLSAKAPKRCRLLILLRGSLGKGCRDQKGKIWGRILIIYFKNPQEPSAMALYLYLLKYTEFDVECQLERTVRKK